MQNHSVMLQKLGLSLNEASVYIALLGLGRTSVQKIAQEAGIKRPTTYLVLDDLRKKGFVLKEPHTKRTLYVAKDPRDAIENCLTEINKVSQSIPELKAIQKQTEKVNVLYYEGLQGMRDSFLYKLENLQNKTFVGFYGKAEDINPSFLTFFDEWNDTLAKKNISFKGIVPSHPSLDRFREIDKLHNRTVRLVPSEKYDSNISIEATNEFVRITLLRQMQSIIIESPEAAKTIKEIFQLLWEKLE